MSLKPGHEFVQDPDAEKVYTFDWTDWVGAADVASYELDIDGPDALLTYDNDAIGADDKSVDLRIQGGTLGKTYRVRCRVTTNESPTQSDWRSFSLKVVTQ